MCIFCLRNIVWADTRTKRHSLLNDYNANKKNGNVRDYILKCLVKREAISKKVKKIIKLSISKMTGMI